MSKGKPPRTVLARERPKAAPTSGDWFLERGGSGFVILAPGARNLRLAIATVHPVADQTERNARLLVHAPKAVALLRKTVSAIDVLDDSHIRADDLLAELRALLKEIDG